MPVGGLLRPVARRQVLEDPREQRARLRDSDGGQPTALFRPAWQPDEAGALEQSVVGQWAPGVELDDAIERLRRFCRSLGGQPARHAVLRFGIVRLRRDGSRGGGHRGRDRHCEEPPHVPPLKETRTGALLPGESFTV